MCIDCHSYDVLDTDGEVGSLAADGTVVDIDAIQSDGSSLSNPLVREDDSTAAVTPNRQRWQVSSLTVTVVLPQVRQCVIFRYYVGMDSHLAECTMSCMI